ncbi:MAG TPA: orotidine-5'-phosphate decarboxylase [Candidatus Eisenbacteria bacterium]|jgi:orotidine-5'-phosphate decarboxylase|nr:orotidine-5'-phosphate decarboxylase [Candidatus Eisenbacteria bacterium]
MRKNADRLIVALDAPTLKEAEQLVERLSPEVKTFKIGKELFTAAGPDAVRAVHARGGRVFLDLKFHDIPNTVASACLAAAALDVFMLNVHASGGREMMTKAAAALRLRAESGRKPILLGVTVLTSLSAPELKETGVDRPLEKQVEHLAALARECGLDGVVASPHEVAALRRASGPDFVLVTPGVRPAWASRGDQKRVMTPAEAVAAGADYLVVGRPITQDADPRAAAAKVLDEIG